MLQNPLTILSFIGRPFDPNSLAAAAGPLMAAYFLILNLSWFDHFRYGFCVFFFQNLRQLQQQLHNRVNPYLICLIHSALILYKKKRFFKKRIMNFPQHTVLKEITIQKEAYLLLYCTSLEICHSGFVTILKFEKFVLKLLQSSVFMHVFITYRFYLPWEIKFSLSKSSGLDSPSLFSVRKNP